MARIATLTGDSTFSHALWPADPETGKRSRREPVTVLDDPAAIDAYFARQAAS